MMVLRLLTRRIGSVTPGIEARIRELSQDQLENLGDALLDFENAADLADWFARSL